MALVGTNEVLVLLHPLDGTSGRPEGGSLIADEGSLLSDEGSLLSDEGSLLSDEGSLLSWLDSTERARFDRFRTRAPREAFLMGRVIAKDAIGRQLGIEGRSLRFRENSLGRPELLDPCAPLSFNISHTSGLVAVALSVGCPVGVDVEDRRRERDIDAIARHVLSSREAAEFSSQDVEGRKRRFYALWTLKEAYLKARGLGLAVRLDQLSFAFGDDGIGGIDLDAPKAIDPAPDAWQFKLEEPSDHHQLAVAVRKTSPEVTAAGTDVPPLRVRAVVYSLELGEVPAGF